jgi:hypothetical protein
LVIQAADDLPPKRLLLLLQETCLHEQALEQKDMLSAKVSL